MKTKSIKKNLTTFVLSILIIIIAVLLLTGIPEKEPNSVILSLTALAILIGVPIFIILFIFLAYVDRVIIKPIHVLVESVKQVSEGNYDTYIEVNREDEIGALAENFNQMITSLKEYREKEIIEKEERDDLIASITHDLSTPLSVIQSHIDGISDGIANTKEKQSEYIEVINDKIRQLDERIKSLKNYSVYNKNKHDFKESIVLKEALDKIVYDLMNSIKPSTGIFHYNNSITKEIRLNLSYRELETIIENIFANAVKYNNKTILQIEINVICSDDRVKIEFKDNGMGIGKEDISKIFIPLYKVDKSRTSNKNSLGLGLSIVKNIIESVGGYIEVASNPGEFTLFTIELPILK